MIAQCGRGKTKEEKGEEISPRRENVKIEKLRERQVRLHEVPSASC